MSDRALSPAHRAQLEASGIRDDVIAGRGYWTATAADADEVKRRGHSAELVRSGAALMLPLHDVHGAVALTVIRPDLPQLDGKGRPKKYQAPRGSKPTLDVHPLARAALGDAAVPLWVTEGQKKADAALSRGAGCVIAVLGVWAWKGNAIPAWDAVTLRDRTVYLAFDSDAGVNPKVQQALRRLKAFLASRGAHARVVHLEHGPDRRKVGLDDALVAGVTLEQLAASSTEDLHVVPIPADDTRPILDVTLLHRSVVLAAFEHLAKAGVYRTPAGVAVIRTDDGPPRVHVLSIPEMRTVLDRVVRCERSGENGSVPTLPPRDLAEALVHDLRPPLPFLKAVALAPTFTADWRYLDQPGYDAASGLFLAFTFTPRPVPTTPSGADLEEARRLWDSEALVDFPFESDADRASAVALALTALVRAAIDGYTPLFVVTAPKPGSGKDLLVKTTLIPTLGRRGWASVTLGKDEELRKALTTHLLEQSPAIVFGNVTGFVHSPILAKVLTDDAWTDRLLGLNRGAHLRVRAVWALTSNNATLQFDLARRTVPIRIVPLTDHPELRDRWTHPEQEQWVNDRRADLLWALAVFVQWWITKGRPGWSGSPKTESRAAIRPLGNYEAWCRIVGGLVTAAGYPDFLGSRAEVLSAADQDTGAWEAFFAEWWCRHGDRLVTATELLPLAAETGVYITGETDQARLASLGKALGQRRDSLFGDYQLRQGTGRNRRHWQLREPPKPAEPQSVTRVSGVTEATPGHMCGPQKNGGNCVDGGVPVGITPDTRVTPVTRHQVPPGVTDQSVVASGALVQLRQLNGHALLETLDGSLELAAVPGSVQDVAVQEALLAATSNAARRDDLRRILERFTSVGAAESPAGSRSQ